MQRLIIYRNASNEISARELEVVYEDDRHLDAYCKTSGGMLKTFRKDRILEDIRSIDDPMVLAKVARYQHQFSIIQHASREQWINRDGKLEICFTGFKSKEKNQLIQHAQNNGFFVRSAVSSGLSFLVCGETAGPAKMKGAKSQGAFLLGKDAYYRLAETGELPIE